MSSGIYISFPGSPARSTRQSLIWSPLGVPYAHSSKEDESCSQWDRLSGHRCGRLTNHSSASASRSREPELRARARGTENATDPHQIFTLSTNIIMESDSGGSPTPPQILSKRPQTLPTPSGKSVPTIKPTTCTTCSNKFATTTANSI